MQVAIQHEQDRLQQAIIRYQQSIVGSKSHGDLDLSDVNTWDQVLRVVDKASEKYNDESGGWGKVRKAFRKFGRSNKVFEAWAEVLPSQSEYFSVLCGGLKLIFGVRSFLSPTEC